MRLTTRYSLCVGVHDLNTRISGRNLATAAGDSTRCAISSADGGGGGGGWGGYPAAATVSSALVVCEIPPWNGAGGGVATSATVSILTHGAGADDSSSSSSSSASLTAENEGGEARMTGTSGASASASASARAVLWIEYLAAGTGDTGVIRPSRGPVWGGTPVRLAVGGGWTHVVGYQGAGCRFGAVAVAARWAAAGEVECVTPSRGIMSGRVDAVVLPDWRTHSFVPAALEDHRAYFRYVRF